MHSIVVNNNIDTVVHFSAILSALGEKDVQKALNVGGERNELTNDWDIDVVEGCPD